MGKNITPYGSWDSPISSEMITAESISLDQITIFNNRIYWLERRPAEAGRNVIVSYRDGQTTDLLPQPFNARSRVHEYGGGVYCVSEHGVYFVNDADQGIYCLQPGESPSLVVQSDGLRFADLQYDPSHHRLLCICEDHTRGTTEPSNSLVVIDTTGGKLHVLHRDHDFYASPRLSHDSSQLAWLCWNHPEMPWDGTELWLADIDRYGALQQGRRIAGDTETSIFQPEWSPHDELFFVSDASGWWNLHHHQDNTASVVVPDESEFGLPQWVFAQSTYAFIDSNTIICSHIKNGVGILSLLELDKQKLTPLTNEWNTYASVTSGNGFVCFIAASEYQFPQLIKYDPHSHKHETISTSCRTDIDRDHISRGKHTSITTRHGDTIDAIVYFPVNKDFCAPADELPPLIVIGHGGPTGMADASLDLRKQYWTSRGFAIADVNYSGSTGFGRDYRERLMLKWGLRDVDDVCDVAQYLADNGKVDKKRMIIKGSSAGGYTVLAALTFHNTFSCGASYYGISDLETLINDTHKFESRYMDKLVGEYPLHKQHYRDRSPINHVEQLDCPVIFFQGLEDKVVPPSQAEMMVEALKHKGIAVSYITFENEQHGFRNADTIKAALNAELYFYARVFNFETADKLEPVTIENLVNNV